MASPHRQQLTEKQLAELSKLWMDTDISLRHLVERFGHSAPWLSSLARRMGLPKRTTGPRSHKVELAPGAAPKPRRAPRAPKDRPLSPAMLHLAQFDSVVAAVRDRQKEAAEASTPTA